MSAENNECIVVPVNVQALSLNSNQITYLNDAEAHAKSVGENPDANVVNVALVGPALDFTDFEANHSSSMVALGTDIPNTGQAATAITTPGIYLQWSLPKAVNTGHVDEQGKATFANLPNRWLITAFCANTQDGDTANSKSWLVQSDKYATDAPQSFPAMAIPLFAAPESPPTTTTPLLSSFGAQGQPQVITAQYLDGVSELSNLAATLDSGAPAVEFTANNMVGPALTASYQQGGMAFGFFDDLSFIDPSQLKTADGITVSYQVIGWHSSKANDVANNTLSDILGSAQYSALDTDAEKLSYILTQLEDVLGWQLNAEVNGEDVALPGTLHTFYTAQVFNVIYQECLTFDKSQLGTNDANDNPYKYALPPGGSMQLSVALGNNAAEAVAKLLSEDENIQDAHNTSGDAKDPNPVLAEQGQLENLLNAFQEDLLRGLGGTDPSKRIEQLDALLHARRFGRKSGGHVWALRAAPGPASPEKPGNGQAELALPLVAAELLSCLNASQAKYDAQLRTIATAQEQLFTDWTQIANLANTSSENLTDALPMVWAELLRLYTLQARAGGMAVTEQNGNQLAAFTPYATVENTLLPTLLLGNLYAEHSPQKSIAELLVYYGVVFPGLVSQTQEALQAFKAAWQASGNTGAMEAYMPEVLVQRWQAKVTAWRENLPGGGGQNALEAVLTSLAATLDKEEKGRLAGLPAGLKSAFWDMKLPADWQKNLEDNASVADTQQAWMGIEFTVLEDTYESNGMPTILQSAWLDGGYQALDWVQTVLESTQEGQGKLNELLTEFNSESHGGIAGNGMQVLTEPVDQWLFDVEQAFHGTVNAQWFDQLEEQLQQLSQFMQRFEGMVPLLLEAYTTLVNCLPLGQQVALNTQLLQAVAEGLVEPAQLFTHPAAPFHHATGPVVAIGEAIGDENVLQPVGRNGAVKLLPCRWSTEIVSAVTGSDSPASTPSVTYLPQGLVITQLFTEAYLLSPNMQAGNANLLGILSGQVTAQQHQRTLSGTNPHASDVTAGVLPYYIALQLAPDGSNDKYNLFLPLYLDWTVEYLPVTQPAHGTAGTFLEAADYLPTNGELLPQQAPETESAAVTYTSRQFLSDTAKNIFMHHLEVYFQNKYQLNQAALDAGPDTSTWDTVDQKLFETYLYFMSNTMLTQGLAGFDATWLGLQPGYQFAMNQPGDYNTEQEEQVFYLNQYAAGMSGTGPGANGFTGNSAIINTAMVDNATFSPLRSGWLKVTKLSITDVFGVRYTLIDADNEALPPATPQIGSGLSKPTHGTQAGYQAYLPPRFVQPLRLQLQWVAGQGIGQAAPVAEFNRHPSYTPVCGWLMHNTLDNSLYCYQPEGQALGYFANTGASTLQWNSVPTSDQNPDNDLAAVTQGVGNPLFAKLLNNYLGTQATSGFFTAIAQTNQHLLGTAAQEKNALALLQGNPLVVVQVALALDAYGDMPVAADSTSFTADYTAYNAITRLGGAKDDSPTNGPHTYYNPASRTTGYMQDVTIPVYLGQRGYLYDGLVGYFMADDLAANDSPTFYDVSRPVNLTPNGSTNVVLVMDPRVPTHATSGILPQQKLQLPPDVYEKAMDGLAMYFTAFPSLFTQSAKAQGVAYQMPLPKEAGYGWAWVQPGNASNQPLAPHAAAEAPQWGYSPQVIQDGWLKLNKEQQ